MITRPLPAAPVPRRHFVRRGAALCLGATLVACQTLGGWNQALADSTPPRIEHEPVRQIDLGASLSVPATVTDDDGDLDGVFLNLRLPGSEQFRAQPMFARRGGEFVGSVPTDGFSLDDTISYFITAIDAAGNEESEGFSFDPFEVTVVAPTASLATVEPDGGNRTVWYVVAGVLAAGAIAALAGGSSNGGGGGAQFGTPLVLVD